jgi:hypothetical protein
LHGEYELMSHAGSLTADFALTSEIFEARGSAALGWEQRDEAGALTRTGANHERAAVGAKDLARIGEPERVRRRHGHAR